MSNLIIGAPIYSDAQLLTTPPLAGGSWLAGLPLTNLQDRRLSKVARSTNAALTSTQFTCGNGAVNRPIGLVALPKHTMSSVGTVRARLYSGGPGLNTQLDFGTGWSSVGTPTRSAAAFVGTDGVPLDLIGDDSAAALEGYTRVLTSMGTTGQVKALAISVKQDTSVSTVIRVRDTTAGADRLLAVLTWSGGLPSLAMTTGTFTGYASVGGRFRLSFLTTAMTTANANQAEVYPATGAALAVAATGNVYAGDLEAFSVTTDRLCSDSGYQTPWPAGLTVEDVAGLNVPWVWIPTGGVFTQPAGTLIGLTFVEINDTTNAAGYVDVARLVLAGAYQPAINMSYGATLGFETETARQVTDGGAALYNVRPVRRTLVGVLEDIEEAEAYGSLFPLQHRLGTSTQCFVVFNPADTTHLWRRSFLAVFKQLSALEHPYFARHRAAFSFVEEL